MSGVGLVGIAAEGNENVHLNDTTHSLFTVKNDDNTIQHFAQYQSEQDMSGPTVVSMEAPTTYVANMPMEDDGIGSGCFTLRLPHIRAERQQGIAWNKDLVASIVKKTELKANKNVVNERTGRQILLDAKTKLNTTRYALYSRLTGMTQNESYPHFQTTADRYMRNRYPPLSHTAIRTHSSFSHMVERPVDLAAGQLSSPIVREDLWLQHVKVSYPDDFFVDIGVTRENVTIEDLQSYTLTILGDQLGNSTSQQYQTEWDVIRDYNILTGNPNVSTDLVNGTSELIQMDLDKRARNLFLYRKKDAIESWWRIWQEFETEWMNQTYVLPKPVQTEWSGTISSFDTSPPSSFYIHVDLSNDTQNNLTVDTYYSFQVQNETDMYGYANNVSQIVGQLKQTGNSFYIECPSYYNTYGVVNTTGDINKTIVHVPSVHAGFSLNIENITTDSNYYDYYQMSMTNVTGSNITNLTDITNAGFEADDRRQLIIGNVTIDVYSLNTNATITSGNATSFIRFPKAFDDSIESTYEGLPVMIQDQHKRAGRFEPNIKPLYELLSDAFPRSYTYNAQQSVEYRKIMENTTVQANLLELCSTTDNTVINYLMQDGIHNSTTTSPINYEIQKIEVVDGISPYVNATIDCLDTFRGLQEVYQPDRYGGYYSPYRKVPTLIHEMNHTIERLNGIDEIKSNTTITKVTKELFPKLIQQYGVISYPYQNGILQSFTPEVYDLFGNVSTTLSTTGFFPGSVNATSGVLSSMQPQFSVADVMPDSLFQSTNQREALMNEIDYVNATSYFVDTVEEANTGGPATKYNATNYFTLLDVEPTLTVNTITNDRNYRFIFWFRIFDWLDKCRLVKEVWATRMYNNSLTYKENLEALTVLNLDFWVYCIQLYDAFRDKYPVIYDEYRLRAPALTQQNLPFSFEVKSEDTQETTQEVQNVTTSYDISGISVENTPYSYHYQNLLFPQPSSSAFSHLQVLNSDFANVSVSSMQPYNAILHILDSFNQNTANTSIHTVSQVLQGNLPRLDSTSSTTRLYDTLTNLTIELLSDPYYTSSNVTTDVYDSLQSFIYDVIEDDRSIPNVSTIIMDPLKQEGGLFQSVRGSTMGYIVAKERSTGIPYQGFQTEAQDWGNVLQYNNHIGNITADLGSYKQLLLSAEDIMSLGLNSTGVNVATFSTTPIANVSPQVFGYKVNIDNPMPVSYEPKTYRSYHYRIPKYIPQSKWDGCDTSLIAILPNPMIMYFEYLRINLVHPDDVPAVHMVTNMSEVMSQGDDPWFLSHSKNKLGLIQDVLTRTQKELTVQEEETLLNDVGYDETDGAKVWDVTTNTWVNAYNAPMIMSKTNANRNPWRQESIFDMNLRMLYRAYVASQNIVDTFGYIESPNYIPRHIQDILMRGLLRSTQSWIAGYIVDTTPSNYSLTAISEQTIQDEQGVVLEHRAVLTEFLRLLSKSNIPIENHRSVKTSYNTVWQKWVNMMKRYIRQGIWEAVLQQQISIVKRVYDYVYPVLDGWMMTSQEKNEVWLEIMYAMMNIEEIWEIEIDPAKTDVDFMDWLYTRLSFRIRNRFQNINPFTIAEIDCIAWKNSVLNMLISL